MPFQKGNEFWKNPTSGFKKGHKLNWKGGSRAHYSREARRAWEKHWKEEVPKGYVIHHIDRDITNNDICNLALLTPGYHTKLHLKGKKHTWKHKSPYKGMTWRIIDGKRKWL